MSRAFVPADQQRVWSWRTSDLFGLAAYDRCNAQLEFLNRFDLALLLHWCLAAENFTLPLSISIVLLLILGAKPTIKFPDNPRARPRLHENAKATRAPAIFLLAERDEIVSPRFHRLVVQAYAGQKRIIELRGAYHNDPIEGTALADLNDALGWMLTQASSSRAP